MDAALRLAVRQRASFCCEYCRLPEAAVEAPFHVEHIIARQHGGSDDEDNLALACDRCNLHKGTNLAGIDPKTGSVVRLFHPRQHLWPDHFCAVGPRIEGASSIGRASVQLLQMNVLRRVQLRQRLLASGEFPELFV